MQVNTPNTSLIEMRIFSRDLQRIKMTPQKKLRCNCASLSESHHKLSGSRTRMQLKKKAAPNWRAGCAIRTLYGSSEVSVGISRNG